jgi:D-arabinose 1-dehydrogenase-like Zn-dependent alcohol dehydrogenase
MRDPGPGEVRVALRASGVCHSDPSIQNGTWAGSVILF